MKKLLLLFFLSFTVAASPQSNTGVAKGTITMYNNRVLGFTNLRFIDDTVVFVNDETASEFTYFLKSVRKIEDDTHKVIFTQQEENFAVKSELVFPDRDKTAANSFFKTDYPEGIYRTKEEFIAKSPGDTDAIVQKGLYGFTKPELSAPEHNCYFYYRATDEKIKRAFAVSYKGNLYFSVYAILSNRNKTDRAQTNDTPNGFVMVMNGGSNYLYTEADLVNAWAQGLAYSGGAIGGAIAGTLVHGKGVVWDFRNTEFNIFKNCNDYNAFIKDKYPDGVQACENQQPDMLLVREAMEKIK